MNPNTTDSNNEYYDHHASMVQEHYHLEDSSSGPLQLSDVDLEMPSCEIGSFVGLKPEESLGDTEQSSTLSLEFTAEPTTSTSCSSFGRVGLLLLMVATIAILLYGWVHVSSHLQEQHS